MLPRGVVCSLLSPFVEGTLDCNALTPWIQQALEKRVDAIAVCMPDVGQGSHVTHEDRHAVATHTARSVAGEAEVLVGFVVNSDGGEEDTKLFHEAVAALRASRAVAAVVVTIRSQTPLTEAVVRRYSSGCPVPFLLSIGERATVTKDTLVLVQQVADCSSASGVCFAGQVSLPAVGALRQGVGRDFWIGLSGPSTVHFLDSMDRGVDALFVDVVVMPVLRVVDERYFSGRRQASVELFHRVLPYLTFATQSSEVWTWFVCRCVIAGGGPVMTPRIEGPMAGSPADDLLEKRADELIGLVTEINQQLEKDQQAAKEKTGEMAESFDAVMQLAAGLVRS